MRFIRHLILMFFIFIKLSVAQKLLLLFLDGFRWDYIKETDLSGFLELKKNGAYIKKVIPVFPSDCHPNIYSIFTGLYPRHHRVLGNRVYSSKSKHEFDHTNSIHRRDVHKWVDAEPLWVTSKNQGKQSFLYHLPTCESSFDPLSPSYCVPFHEDFMTMSEFNTSVKEAVRSLISGAASMAVVYNDQLDRITHSFGPQSATLTDHLLPQIDTTIQWLLKVLRKHGIHLVVLSDHGMAQIALDRQIYLERLILRSEIDRVINQGGYASIWPKPGYLALVEWRLRLANVGANFVLYTHGTMPQHWNVFDGGDLSPPLLLVAEPGYFISSNEMNFPRGDDFYSSGWHGYAPEHEEMASPLLAFGPRMQTGTSIDKIHVTDVYQLLAHILDIVPQSHNGSSSFLPSLLLESYSESRNDHLLLLEPSSQSRQVLNSLNAATASQQTRYQILLIILVHVITLL